jgi:hypothetical protein
MFVGPFLYIYTLSYNDILYGITSWLLFHLTNRRLAYQIWGIQPSTNWKFFFRLVNIFDCLAQRLDSQTWLRDRRGCDCMVVGFITTYAIILFATVPITTKVVSSNPTQAGCTRYNIMCQWLAAGLWFSPGTPVSSTNKTDRHFIAEILLKVELNTIILIKDDW